MSRYSQGGQEDWLLEHFLGRIGIAVDVGANDGQFYSNTLRMEELGWRVICIEPNVRCLDALIKRRAEVVFCAVSDYDGIGALTVMESENGINASGTALEPIETHRPIIAVDAVKVRTLDSLLDEAGVGLFDLLSLDCEGGEVRALQGLTMARHAPEVIIVERNDEAGISRVLGTRYREVERTDSDTIYLRVDA